MHKYSFTYLKTVIITILAVVADIITKQLATVYLKGGNDFEVIKNVLVLHYLDGGNDGAAWGLFSGKRIIFLVFTLAAMIIISMFIRNIHLLRNNSSLKNKTLNIMEYTFAFLLAGALGNFIDRLLYGYVIDFIYFKLIDFPIFNLADCYVTVSCFVLILICIFKINEKDFNMIFTLKFNDTGKDNFKEG